MLLAGTGAGQVRRYAYAYALNTVAEHLLDLTNHNSRRPGERIKKRYVGGDRNQKCTLICIHFR